RKEEILLGTDELAVVWKLRRVLHALDQQQAIELLLDRMKPRAAGRRCASTRAATARGRAAIAREGRGSG
ncbi:hypothetical protein DLE01_06860, partial [Streptomyces sp. FT05W]